MLVELATAHAGDGVQVAIIAPPGRLDRDWQALGIERMLIPSAERDPVDLARAARCVRSALRGWLPDVVHAHNVKATAMSLTGARGISARTPVLTTLHGVAPRQTRAAAGILRFADMVAAVSNEVRQQIVSHGLKAQRVEVVHNGVTEIPPLDDLTRATYDRELALNGPVIASVGRLAPEKAQDRFLAAAAIVLDSCPDATFLIVGDGPRWDLEKPAAELGIEHAVRFTGTRDDARLLIDRADIMVLSSDREGHSIAALEAWPPVHRSSLLRWPDTRAARHRRRADRVELAAARPRRRDHCAARRRRPSPPDGRRRASSCGKALLSQRNGGPLCLPLRPPTGMTAIVLVHVAVAVAPVAPVPAVLLQLTVANPR